MFLRISNISWPIESNLYSFARVYLSFVCYLSTLGVKTWLIIWYSINNNWQVFSMLALVLIWQLPSLLGQTITIRFFSVKALVLFQQLPHLPNPFTNSTNLYHFSYSTYDVSSGQDSYHLMNKIFLLIIEDIYYLFTFRHSQPFAVLPYYNTTFINLITENLWGINYCWNILVTNNLIIWDKVK